MARSTVLEPLTLFVVASWILIISLKFGVVVMSALQVIEEIFTQFGVPIGATTRLISNRMLWGEPEPDGDAVINGWSDPLIHMYNKVPNCGLPNIRMTQLVWHDCPPCAQKTARIHGCLWCNNQQSTHGGMLQNQSVVPAAQLRPHILLLGDGVGDVAMADGAPDGAPEVTLKVGFLNENVAALRPQCATASASASTPLCIPTNMHRHSRRTSALS
eukprot:SAG11_NODE_1928_length_4053_cov_6.814112_1_plen_216_part_00